MIRNARLGPAAQRLLERMGKAILCKADVTSPTGDHSDALTVRLASDLLDRCASFLLPGIHLSGVWVAALGHG